MAVFFCRRASGDPPLLFRPARFRSVFGSSFLFRPLCPFVFFGLCRLPAPAGFSGTPRTSGRRFYSRFRRFAIEYSSVLCRFTGVYFCGKAAFFFFFRPRLRLGFHRRRNAVRRIRARRYPRRLRFFRHVDEKACPI